MADDVYGAENLDELMPLTGGGPQYFKQALSVRGRVPQAYPHPFDADLAALRKRLEADPKQMYTPEQIEQRRGENERDYTLSVAAMLSGDQGLQGAGGQIFKQALAGRQPHVTEKGSYDPITGQFTLNAEAQREALQQRLERMQTLDAQGQLSWEKQQGAEAARMEEIRQRGLDRQVLAGVAAGNKNQGSFVPSARTPDGRTIVTNSKTGVDYVVSIGPDGQTPQYEPWTGKPGAIPKATFEASSKDASTQSLAADRAGQLIAQVDANPEVFGSKGALLSKVPVLMQGMAAERLGLNSKALETRADVLRQAAMTVHDLYGAAFTAGEAERAKTFVPNANDPPEILISKLRSAQRWSQDAASRYGPGVLDDLIARQGRTGVDKVRDPNRPKPALPANDPGNGLTPEQEARRQELLRKYPQAGQQQP